jgi:predicted RNase H-like HicB family nuclease
VSREFIAVVFRTSGGAFAIEFPDLIGCVASAATYSSCPDEAARALTAHLAAIEVEGYAVPKPSSLGSVMANPRNLEGVPIAGLAGVRLRKPEVMISGAQVKEARKLLKWSMFDLGCRAHVSETTIAAFEGAARRTIRPDKVQAMQRALESAGVIFVEENGEGPGARLRQGK